MAEDSEQISGAEEFVAAEIDLAAPLDPDQEKNLHEALEKIDPRAFDSCDIGPEKVSLCYDPTRTNKKELLNAIRQAGGKLKHVESDRSPLLDSPQP